MYVYILYRHMCRLKMSEAASPTEGWMLQRCCAKVAVCQAVNVKGCNIGPCISWIGKGMDLSMIRGLERKTSQPRTVGGPLIRLGSTRELLMSFGEFPLFLTLLKKPKWCCRIFLLLQSKICSFYSIFFCLNHITPNMLGAKPSFLLVKYPFLLVSIPHSNGITFWGTTFPHSTTRNGTSIFAIFCCFNPSFFSWNIHFCGDPLMRTSTTIQ